ncbi:hypothetical protein FACS1894140_5640 [Spirochaetia bacterium]|nr:hypothetical protein FACS1894140_5640 [Spirochaetia bacterium]
MNRREEYRLRRGLFVVLLFFPALFSLWAQDADFSDWDIDSLFEEPAAGADTAELPEDDGKDAAGKNVLAGLVRQKGFSLEASYYFYGGFAPGWNPAPWHGDAVGCGEERYSYVIGGGVSSGIGLDFQISDALRLMNTFGFSYPGFDLTVKQFFLDYNIKNAVFIRAGKYEAAWGISPNFQFANLLSRVPDGSSGGDAVTAKVDIPIGVGGLQFLALTRDDFIRGGSAAPKAREIGYGAKYNLAFPWADIDLGSFFLADMPLRAFLSVKKTVKDTELYTEGMFTAPFPRDTADDWNFSANVGVVQAFFADKLTVNGELFYNGEKGAGWFRQKTDLRDADVSPFIGGINTALNLVFRPGFYGLRFFTQFLYGFSENTAQLVPGFSFDPLPRITVSLAVPMALGRANGTYYTHNADTENRPLSIVLLVSLSGSHRFGFFE